MVLEFDVHNEVEQSNTVGESCYSTGDGEHEQIELQAMDEPELPSRDSGDDHERREQWDLLKNSNPVVRFLRRIWNGPEEPSDDTPTFFERYVILKQINRFPTEYYQKGMGNELTRVLILITYCSLWFGINLFFLYPQFTFPSYFVPSDLNVEKIPAISLDCNSYLNWEGTNNACGLFDEDCRPFEDQEYYIKCPALCDMGGIAYSAVAVGPKRVKYVNYVIGGGLLPDIESRSDNKISYPFRADSYPCASAVHLGLISPFTGGCAKLSMSGTQKSFASAEGEYGMGWSVPFRSFFPSSFLFKEVVGGYLTGCLDPRAPLVILNLLFGIPVFFLYESIYGYWIMMIAAYWTLVLALDPPVLADPQNMESVYSLFSVGFQRLLPLCFILYVMWKVAVKRTLENGSPILKILLWYPLFWLGVMNNITFDRLPVDRLNAKDLREQPGASTAVGTILATIIICAFTQAYSLWKSGRFRKYFKIYITMIIGILLLASIPGLNLRIHHYILGMVLVPGCATRSLPAYGFQGILIGLILSGVSRWDFASIVETDYALLRDEAGASVTPPNFVFDSNKPHMISWTLLESTDESYGKDFNGLIDGYSLLLNDFEVYVGKNETVDLDILINENEILSNMLNNTFQEESTNNIEMYLRVARASLKFPARYRGDYTNAAVLIWPEGVWYDPLPGVS